MAISQIPMGFRGHDEWGDIDSVCIKRKFRWKFIIPDVSAYGVDSLPPLRSGKPSLAFKEMTAEHLNETIAFPSKPEWKPITLTLYDINKGKQNPVFTWLKRAYDPSNCSLWKPSCNGVGYDPIKAAQVWHVLYDGCGHEIDKWVFEHAWPQSVEFSDGDMASSEIVTCDLTLRYDRAYQVIPQTESELADLTGDLPSYTCVASISPVSQVSMTMFSSLSIPEFVCLERF